MKLHHGERWRKHGTKHDAIRRAPPLR